MMIGKTGIFTIFGFHYSEYVVVLKDHVHMHIEYPPKLAIAKIVKPLKGRTSRMLQAEYSHLIVLERLTS